ncbi:putative ornithine aminotransferase [Thozetella sp. PMI_491]|nr:putative ornithine aminotransferase [Thozetella sp. PMI_491]
MSLNSVEISARWIDEEVVEIETQYGISGVPAWPIVMERGSRAHLWSTSGRRYFDFTSAFSTLNQGHCHPKIFKAGMDQCQKLMLPGRSTHTEQYSRLCKKMCNLLELDVAVPTNSGSEAIDMAVKIARKWSYEKKGVPADQALILTATLNYHGRMLISLSSTQNSYIGENMGPFVPGIGPEVAGEPVVFGDCESLECTFKSHGDRIAPFMIERIQGNAVCIKYNVPWIADEIQCGMGRTGHLLAYQCENVKPDIVALGKSLVGGAYSIGMVVGKAEAMRCYKFGQHGSTFAGNPVAAAAALAAVGELGPRIEARLRSIKSPHFRKIEGRGMLHTLFIHESTDGRVTGPRLAKLLVKRGFLTSAYGPKIRIAPPLITSEEDLWPALDEVEKALSDLPNIVDEPILP